MLQFGPFMLTNRGDAHEIVLFAMVASKLFGHRHVTNHGNQLAGARGSFS